MAYEKMRTPSEDITKPEPLGHNPTLVEQQPNDEISKLIAAIKPASTQQKILESDTAKQIIWKVTDDSTIEMTTNLSDDEISDLKGLLFWYQITGNPRIAIEYLATLRMAKSRSDRGHFSLLEGLFSFMNFGEEEGGLRGKVGKWIAGR